MCCNPSNSWYIKCDGTTHINAQTNTVSNFAWNSSPVVIGIKCMLSEKKIWFYKDSPDNECGPYDIPTGNNFRIVSGHCNTGNGTLIIPKCEEL